MCFLVAGVFQALRASFLLGLVIQTGGLMRKGLCVPLQHSPWGLRVYPNCQALAGWIVESAPKADCSFSSPLVHGMSMDQGSNTSSSNLAEVPPAS